MGIFKSNSKKSRRESGKTIIAEGSFFRGEVGRIEGGLLIDGTFEGVIESEFDLAVGNNGLVRGLVKARQIVVTGTIEGKVICDHIEILQTGKLVGELIAGNIAIETGGKFVGKSQEMTESSTLLAFAEEDKQRIIRQPEQIIQIVETIETVHIQTVESDLERASEVLPE